MSTGANVMASNLGGDGFFPGFFESLGNVVDKTSATLDQALGTANEAIAAYGKARETFGKTKERAESIDARPLPASTTATETTTANTVTLPGLGEIPLLYVLGGGALLLLLLMRK